jgi:hypothetical protein
MNELKTIIEDLETFFSDDETLITDAPEEEKQINEEEEKNFASEEAALTRPCARIRYGLPCGFATSGKIAYVVNARNNKRVRATVRVKWRQSINNGQHDRVLVIPAGSEKQLGCTRSDNIPVVDYNFSVVGCEIL